MSIHGVGAGAPVPLQPERADGQRRPDEGAPLRHAAPETASRRDLPAAVSAAEVPAGVDPALWSVLTGEERSFFARARELGPLTYGPGAPRRTGPAAVVGGRVDIRV
jgi:hypothetical protein